MEFPKFKLHVAPFSNFPSIGDAFLGKGKQTAHFLFCLQIEFFCGKAHPVFIFKCLPCLNTQQHIMNRSILPLHIMDIISGNQRNSGFLRKLNQCLIHRSLFLKAMILKLQKEVSWSEDFIVCEANFPGLFKVAFQQKVGDFPAQTGT